MTDAIRRARAWLSLGAAALVACGGGGDDSDNWARLRDAALAPAMLPAPTTSETLQVKLEYFVDFESDTHLPTFQLAGHLLPEGQTLLSPDASAGRVLTQFCGQQAYACGDPFTKLCNVTVGWLDPTKRRVVCDSCDPAIEAALGRYQFIASVCYTDSKGTRVCSSKALPIVLG